MYFLFCFSAHSLMSLNCKRFYTQDLFSIERNWKMFLCLLSVNVRYFHLPLAQHVTVSSSVLYIITYIQSYISSFDECVFALNWK